MPSIGVYARLRPTPGLDSSKDIVIKRSAAEQRSVQVKNLEFTLDHVFDAGAKQSSVYDIIGKERVPRVLAGENCCFLCYGQTGSGKTHTMFGPSEVVADWGAAPAEHGLAPRAISTLFESVAASGSTCSVQCQYVEVYNDGVNDLLGGKKSLALREAKGGVVVEGLASAEVHSLEDAMRQLHRGNASRVTAKMSMNARSSRGHALFTLSLQSRSGDSIASGKLVLVDLAGMESSKKSYSVEGESSKPQRREEARHINTSLFALGSVVERLSASSKGGGAGHVPFRNAKLTRLLQDSLGGSSACAVVVTLRAERENLDECVSTLRFAQRAAGVPVVVRSTVATAAPDPVMLVKELRGATEELAEAKALIEQLQLERGALQRGASAEAEAAEAAAAARRELAKKDEALQRGAAAEAKAAEAAAKAAEAAAAAQRELAQKEDALKRGAAAEARSAEAAAKAAEAAAAAQRELAKKEDALQRGAAAEAKAAAKAAEAAEAAAAAQRELAKKEDALQRGAAAAEAAAAAQQQQQRELAAKEDALNVARLQIEQLHAKMAEMMEEAAAGGAAARKQLEAENEENAAAGRPSLGASMRASRRGPPPEMAAPPAPAARAAGRAAAARPRSAYFDSSAHEAALDDYLECSSPILQRLSTSQANASDGAAPTKIEAMTLGDDSLAEKLELGRSLRPGYVPRDLVSAQLDALADAEEDIEAELADLDVIDLASESPILSDAARRMMQFAQLSKFMKAGTAQLNATRRSVCGETIDTADFSIEDHRLGGTVDFSIGDLHRLVLELPSVPVEKLRRELHIVGDTPRALKEEDCVGRTTIKSRSAAMVAAARGA